LTTPITRVRPGCGKPVTAGNRFTRLPYGSGHHSTLNPIDAL
jgi:hypothetical protein